MKSILVLLLLVASCSASPIGAQKFDMGSAFVVGMLKFMWNGTNGCVSSCENSASCPGAQMPTEANLRTCVDCVLQCNPEMTKCYTARGATVKDISDAISGLLDAVYIDGCRVKDAAAECPMPMNMAAFHRHPGAKPPAMPKGCPEPGNLPPLPAFVTAAVKAKMCEHMKCAYGKVVASPACKRGSVVFGEMHTMIKAWLQCS